MPDRSRKRPRDLNALAASIVTDATGETPEPESDDGKDPAAVALGRRGGLKGGRARAEKLTPEQRSAAARKASQVRWNRHQAESSDLDQSDHSISPSGERKAPSGDH